MNLRAPQAALGAQTRPGPVGALEPSLPAPNEPGRGQVYRPFLDPKGRFSSDKVRYRGLAKNTERFALMLRLSNLNKARRWMAAGCPKGYRARDPVRSGKGAGVGSKPSLYTPNLWNGCLL